MTAITPITAGRPAEGAVSADVFRGAMRSLAGAVSVVTTGQGETRTGFTATSVASLSLTPPTLLVCLHRDSATRPTLETHRSFCVNILAHDQSHVADRFAGRDGARGAARYEGALWQQQPTGTLGLSDALAIIDCELEEAIERHTHTILIGRARAVTLRHDAQPLLYWHGDYRLMSALDRALAPA